MVSTDHAPPGAATFPLVGAIYVLGGTISYCVMDGLVKWVAPSYPIFEITFFRMAFSFIPLALMMIYDSAGNSIRTKRIGSHLVRCAFGTVGMVMIFQSLKFMSLLDVTVIIFACPIFTTVLSAPILKERVSISSWIAVVFGFLCVLFVLEPSTSIINFYAILPLAGSLCIAVYILSARLLAKTENSISLAFYMALIGSLTTGATLPFNWVTPSPGHFLIMAAIGIVGGVGLVLRTAGYRAIPTAIASPIEYSSLLWSGAIGLMFFGERPKVATVVAGLLVILSNLYVLYNERRR
jgi:drug/metabolite transporter (DMT)-like permease